MHRRRRFIIAERQLWPQPPADARPWWCYINTLIFYQENPHREAWRQDIPEAKLFLPKFERALDCSVFRDKEFGWCLRVSVPHRMAKVFYRMGMKMLAEYVERKCGEHRESMKLIERT